MRAMNYLASLHGGFGDWLVWYWGGLPGWTSHLWLILNPPLPPCHVTGSPNIGNIEMWSKITPGWILDRPTNVNETFRKIIQHLFYHDLWLLSELTQVTPKTPSDHQTIFKKYCKNGKMGHSPHGGLKSLPCVCRVGLLSTFSFPPEKATLSLWN